MGLRRGDIVVTVLSVVALVGCGEEPTDRATSFETEQTATTPVVPESTSLPETSEVTSLPDRPSTTEPASTTNGPRQLRPVGLSEELDIDNVVAIATSALGAVAFGTDDGFVLVLPTADATEPERIDMEGVSVNDVAFDDTGRLLVAALDDGSVQAFKRLETKWVPAWISSTSHVGAATAVVVAPDGEWVASAGADERLRRWSFDGGVQIGEVIDLDNPTTDLAITEDGGTVLATAAAGRLLSIAVDDGSVRPVPGAGAASGALALDGTGLLWGSGGTTAWFVDVAEPSGTDRISDTLDLGPTFSEGVSAIAVWDRPDGTGRVVAAGGSDGSLGSVVAWDPSEASSFVEVASLDESATAIAISADGSAVFFADYRTTYRQRMVNR